MAILPILISTGLAVIICTLAIKAGKEGRKAAELQERLDDAEKYIGHLKEQIQQDHRRVEQGEAAVEALSIACARADMAEAKLRGVEDALRGGA